MEQKIYRDQEVNRVVPGKKVDLEDLIHKVFALMENVAALMTYKIDNKYELVETIDVQIIREEAEKIFSGGPVSILSILLNSVLMPITYRRKAALKISFALKTFHEFFLASYLYTNRIDVSIYPKIIQQYHSELSPDQYNLEG